VEAEALRPRGSVQVALTVTVPGTVPDVSKVAVVPLPATVPPVAVQPLTVTGTLSGLVQVQDRFTLPPTCTVVGLAEQDMVGGFFGGSFTVKDAEQLSSPPFFTLASVM
jgi:hypothetical protein